MGRIHSAEDDKPGAPRVVVLSHRFWQDRFGGANNVLGESLTLDGNSYSIIGVMPAGFTLPNHPTDQLWPGLQLTTPNARAPFYLLAYGRLAPGVDSAQARAELASIAAAVKRQYPDSPPQWTLVTTDLKTMLVGDRRTTVLILYAAVALILLMASANVANLTLARAAARLPELSLRMALGAGRRRLIRQLLTESLLIASLGGVLGLAIAYIGTDFLAAAMPGGMPHLRDIRIDRWVLFFTAAIALLTGLAIGLVPALHLTSDRPGVELGEGTRGGSHGTRHRRFASTLIVSEFALALTVLVSAGLAVSSLIRLQRVDVGVRKDGLLVVRVTIPSARYQEPEKVDAFFDDAMQRVRGLPGVTNVAVSMAVPPDRLVMRNPFTPQGKVFASNESAPVTEWILVSPDYFTTLGIPVLRGRAFTEADRGWPPNVAIVNETFARQAFPGADALGKWVQSGDPDPTGDKLTIVGIVPDVKYQGVNVPQEPTLYVPYKQALWWRSMYLIVGATGDPLAQAQGVRAVINRIDPLIAIRETRTMERLMSESVEEPRYLALLLSTFALLGLILAGAGIYGVLSYNVSQRMRETGIRLALGATSREVMGLVIRDGMRLAILGVVIGIGIALATTRLLTSILYEVSPLDPTTFAVTALFLILVGLLACAIPARRASRTDPMVAIRAS
jgi:putative ABC transport system permease protein